MDLKDKVVIVTGATSGIGLAISQRLSQDGARVILVGRDQEKGQQAESQIKNGTFIQADVTSEDSIKTLVEQVIQKFNQIDIVVNNAGIDFTHPDITKITENQYNQMMNTDFKSVVLMTKHTIPYLLKSKGNIVNISSQLGLTPDKEVPLYCSAKAAVIMFTKTQALAYAPEGVRINCVCPGATKTPLLKEFFKDDQELEDWYSDPSVVPLKRVGKPEEIANVVKFLASDQASYVTGAIWLVDGGSSLGSSQI